MAKRRAIILSFATILVVNRAAYAQEVPLSELLVDLIQSDIRLAPPTIGLSHEAHFIPGADQQIAPYFFNQQLAVQIGTFPLGSPAGGFSFQFDSATGSFRRSSDSFGPAFAERAVTVGKNKLSAGANFQYAKYNSFEGADLDGGDVRFYLRHQSVTTPPAFFEGDVVEASLRLDVTSATTTVFANYGVTDSWDFAVALPFQRVKMDANVDARVLRFSTGSTSSLHVFPNGTDRQTFSSAGEASGIGDLVLRTKYRFVTMPGGGIAVGLDLRLPTGDAENLLGSDATQGTVTFIASSTKGAFAPHFNVGFTGTDSGEVVGIPNELTYRAGAEFIATPRVTLSADFIGRTLFDVGKLEFGDNTYSYRDINDVPQTTTLTELNSTTGSLNLQSLAAGAKFNVAGNLLINANVLVALNSRGLTARVTPVVGFDYSF